jgi:hypothetical protein
MYIDYTEQELVDALRRNGEKIGKQAQEDNAEAKAVVKYYSLWYSCPGDQCAFVLTEKAYKDWVKADRPKAV